MPKQLGLVPMSGTMDDLTFYVTEDYGNLVKQKGGPTREQVLYGDNYEHTRMNNEELGRSSKYGKIIRRAFKLITNYSTETKMHTNLSTRIRQIMNMDKESDKGKRDLRRDTITAFRHFEFDSKCLSKQYFSFPVEIKANKGCAEITTVISFKKKPKEACAWKVISVAASIDLATEYIVKDEKESKLFKYDKKEHAMRFTHYYEEELLLFHGMCIVFYAYDDVTDEYKPLKGRHVHSGFVRYVDAMC